MRTTATIEVPFVISLDQSSPIETISAALDNSPKIQIGNAPWPQFPYKPECAFAMKHGVDCIFLKFFIKEDDLLVRFTQPNDHVYRDSCVEFFIGFDDDENYYNLEFNSIGTCFLGYCIGDQGIQVADSEVVRKIRSSFILGSENGEIKWELTLVIPTEVFFKHNYASLVSKKAKANFYKCGDDMPVPHYLAWNNIESEKPNFHLPQFFGDIVFIGPANG